MFPPGGGQGRAGAWVAGADDPSGLFYNPASIADTRGQRLYLGGTLEWYDAHVETAAGREALHSGGVLIPPIMAYSQRVGRIAVGVGLSAPYGFLFQHKDPGPSGVGLVAADLKGFSLSPVLALPVSRALLLGVGADVRFSSLALTYRQASGELFEASSKTGTGTALCAGIAVRPTGSRLSLALALWLPSTVDLDSSDARLRPGTIRFPSAAHAGVAYAGRRWSAELAARRVFWTKHRLQSISLPTGEPAFVLEGWRDATDYMAGVSWRLRPRGRTRVSGGLRYRTRAVPDAQVQPVGVDHDAISAHVGLRYRLHRMTVDVSARASRAADRTVGPPGAAATYSRRAGAVAYAIGYDY